MTLLKVVKKQSKTVEMDNQDVALTPDVKAMIGKIIKKHRKSLEILAKH